MTTSLAGRQTEALSFGNGPARGVLLHCSLGRALAYTPLLKQIGDLLTVTSFDQPGHGRAEPWTGDEEEDLQDVVRAMARDMVTSEMERTGQPVHLIGHSFGGTVAVRLAQEAPDLVASLTLIEPVMIATAYVDHPEMKAMQAEVLSAFYDAFEKGERDTATHLFTSVFGDGRPWETLSEGTRASMSKRIHMVVAGDIAVHEDCYGLASGKPILPTTIPTLILNSTTGGPVMEAVFEGIKRRIPQAHHVQFPHEDVRHMLPLTHPELTAAEIRRFLTPLVS